MSLPPAYPILDLDSMAGRDPVALVGMWMALGLDLFQLRAKGLPVDEYVVLAEGLRRAQPRARIISNDHLAPVLDRPGLFAGIHLGQEDLAALRLRHPELLSRLARACPGDGSDASKGRDFRAGDSLLYGLSTHNAKQLAASYDPPPGYLAIGPVLSAASKPAGRDPVLGAMGVAQAFDVWSRVRGARPLVLIGGVDAVAFESLLALREARQLRKAPVPAAIRAALDSEELARLIALRRRFELDLHST